MTASDFRLAKSKYLSHQWEFLTSTARECALVSGYGGGKTHVFIRKVFLAMTNLVGKKGRSNGWVIYPTLDLGEELFMQPFIEFLTENRIWFHRKRYHIKTLYGDLRLYTLQRPDRFVGSELTYVGFDEFDIESRKNCDSAWTKVQGRLRGCDNPQLFIVTTPEGFRKTYDMFVKDNKDARRHLIRAKTTDNPYLPDSYIETLVNTYDAKLLAQYMDGEFVNLNGEAAYYAFDRDTHVVYRDISPTSIWVGMDFNVNPMTAVVVAPFGQQQHVLDEIWLRNSNTRQMCEVIKQRYPRQHVTVCPDMTGVRRQTSAESGVTDVAILRQFGFTVLGSRNPRVKDRLNTVNNAFDKNLTTISPDCKHLIDDLERVVRDDYGRLDESDKDRTHISDAFGYAVTRLIPIRAHGRR